MGGLVPNGDDRAVAAAALGVLAAVIGLAAALVGRKRVVVTREEVVYRDEAGAAGGRLARGCAVLAGVALVLLTGLGLFLVLARAG